MRLPAAGPVTVAGRLAEVPPTAYISQIAGRSPRKAGGRKLHEAGPGRSPRGRVAPLLDLT